MTLVVVSFLFFEMEYFFNFELSMKVLIDGRGFE
jgi:hypothetical protein